MPLIGGCAALSQPVTTVGERSELDLPSVVRQSGSQDLGNLGLVALDCHVQRSLSLIREEGVCASCKEELNNGNVPRLGRLHQSGETARRLIGPDTKT